MHSTGIPSLRKHYFMSLIGVIALLLLALFAHAWHSLSERQAAIQADLRAQGEQLRLILDDKINLIQGHVFLMRREIENALARTELADPEISGRLLQGIGLQGETDEADEDTAPTLDVGAIHVRPGTTGKKDFLRDLAAAASLLTQAAGNHQWYRIFQWSYYYDASENWFLIYPRLPRKELLQATSSDSVDAALDVIFAAHGTHPVQLAGPRKNPDRSMVWTPPYPDSGGKGMMVSLLAPVFLADEYIGAIGSDITLDTLSRVLETHAPKAGRALLIDADQRVLADEADAAVNAEQIPRLVDLFADADVADPQWLRFPVADTPWTLVVHLNTPELKSLVTDELRTYFALALLLFTAILAIGAFQHSRYASPALGLAAFVESCSEQNQPPMPEVPAVWQPLFTQVARITRERQQLLKRTRDHAEELEQRVAARTAELQRANDSLTRTIATLHQTQSDLLRADRLGALGGLIAGVANELRGPIGEAHRRAQAFLQELQGFQKQFLRGLRKSELEALVEQALETGRHVSRETAASLELLGRFRQLAVDQASERPRRFALHEVAENVLAAMRPVLANQSARVLNSIPRTIELEARAGIIGQILHHLLADALDRAEQAAASAEIELSGGHGNDERGDWVLLVLTDRTTSPQQPQSSLLAEALVREACRGEIETTGGQAGSRIVVRIPQSPV